MAPLTPYVIGVGKRKDRDDEDYDHHHFPIGVGQPVEEEKREEGDVVAEEKPKKKRARKQANPEKKEESETTIVAKKSKKDILLEDFMLIQLPALRKEVKLRKKAESSFNVREYPLYFKPGGDFTPTYCLSLFHFLGRNEIVCTQYGVFDSSRHMVKTVDGFNHANLIISSVGEDTLTPEEGEHMMRRFGREWFKIPAKDASKVSSAFRFGDAHQFKVILTGIYEDSFFGESGEEVKTANPVLRYEPYRAPAVAVKKPKKASSPASTPVEKEREIL